MAHDSFGSLISAARSETRLAFDHPIEPIMLLEYTTKSEKISLYLNPTPLVSQQELSGRAKNVRIPTSSVANLTLSVNSRIVKTEVCQSVFFVQFATRRSFLSEIIIDKLTSVHL